MNPHPALLVVLCALLTPPPSVGLELSLVENKAESGSIGYVDIRRVFKEYTEARRTRDAFARRVEEKERSFTEEEQALLRLKAELTKLEQERSFLLKLPILEPPKPKPEPSEDDLGGLPGMSTPLGSIEDPDTVAASTATVAVSSEAAAAAPLPEESEEPEPAQAQTGPGITRQALEKQLIEIGNKMKPIHEKVTQAEQALAEAKASAERQLLDEEKQETKRLLARIYETVKEVAKDEGISVVIDKESILFGQPSVDLTEKVLEKL